jgi:hypothetical protein
MRKKQTSPNRRDLSATQRDAIRLLASGCTAKYTALVLKLDYTSVRQWMKQDALFQSELALQSEKQKARPVIPAGPSRPKKIPADKNSGVNLRAAKSRGKLVPD